MKKLTIEEKAKAYDEALERAKECHIDGLSLHQPVKDVIEHIFPELSESEDERIRKELIAFLKYYHTGQGNCVVYDDDWIAWLEKQSTPQVRTGLEWVNTIDDACDKRYSEEYAHGEYCHEQSFKWGFQEGVDWLEKQGEQKPANTPKFKVGDILVSEEEDRRHIYKVEAITNYDTYLLLDLEDGYTRNESVYICDLAMYLWTIQDAKDGDVLANDISVFIYAKVLYSNPYAYCGVDKFGVFKDNCLKYNWSNGVDNIHPATKEQRDLLFQKMKESGYEWNVDKKELKKIEQNLAWSALDEINLQGIIDEIEANKNFAPESDLVTYDRYLSWLKSIRTKNTWKPSDEQMDALETAVSSLQSNTLETLFQDLKREKNYE